MNSNLQLILGVVVLFYMSGYIGVLFGWSIDKRRTWSIPKVIVVSLFWPILLPIVLYNEESI